MTARPVPAGPTDRQVGDIIRFLARTCLEVERGLRRGGHLHRLLDPAVADQWHRRRMLGRYPGGPVLDSDLGSVRWSRYGGRIVATATTRTNPDRWGSLTLQLDRRDDGRWQLTDLQRLLTATRYNTRHENPLPPPEPSDPQQRHQLATGDRRLAKAALDATRRRLTDLDGNGPAVRAARELARHWTATVTQLDLELAALNRRSRASPAAASRAVRR